MSNDFNEFSIKSIEVIKTSNHNNKKNQIESTIFEQIANSEVSNSERITNLIELLKMIDKRILELKKAEQKLIKYRGKKKSSHRNSDSM